YTSGSTGTPKGVMVEHRGLNNLARSQISIFDVQASSRVMLFASFNFDASISEIVMALLSGASLHVPVEIERTTGLSDYVISEGITHATLTPATLRSVDTAGKLEALHALVIAGEALARDLIDRLPRSVSVFNAYGPTESTVCASVWPRPAGYAGDVVPIGRPIANTRIY
ncbi:AMP-binding protein, partial [Methylobacterium phyllosphaerae]